MYKRTFFPAGRMELPTTNDRKRDTSIIQEFLRSTEATSRDKKRKENKKVSNENSKKRRNENLQLALYIFSLMFCVPFWLVVLCFGEQREEACVCCVSES